MPFNIELSLNPYREELEQGVIDFLNNPVVKKELETLAKLLDKATEKNGWSDLSSLVLELYSDVSGTVSVNSSEDVIQTRSEEMFPMLDFDTNQQKGEINNGRL